MTDGDTGRDTGRDTVDETGSGTEVADLVAGPARPDGPRGTSSSSTFRVVLLGVLVVALLASAGTLVWLVAGRRGEADDLQAQRESVMAQSRQFMLRVNTYGPDLLEGEQMPEYRKLVTEVITPKFAASFDEGVAAAEKTVQSGIARTAVVSGVGVSSIDSDSATALVAGSFTNSYPTSATDPTRVEDAPLPFRVEVKLVKTKGTWLVDDFSPITGADQ